jgi:DNA-binding transcriptional LysR family regulator
VDRFDDMRVFVKVVESGNFISAAARLRKRRRTT